MKFSFMSNKAAIIGIKIVSVLILIFCAVILGS